MTDRRPVAVALPTNRPPQRFYRGGARISALRGDPPGPDFEPEDWVASTTHVFGEPGVGETSLPGGQRLRDAIAADPVGWLGVDHLRRWGLDTGLLVKLLDAGQRLPVHAHPDDRFARRHLGRAHGKTEAWYILEGGTVHLGLSEGVPADQLRRWIETQDSERMLDALNAVGVEPGDGILVPAGTLHAIGAGVLLVEVQQPEDLSILLEWRDFALDGPRDGHLGLGFDLALDAVDTRRTDAARIDALVRRAGTDPSVLPAAADAFFTVERFEVKGRIELPPGFAVLVVESGSVRTAAEIWPRGSTAVIPAAARVILEGTGVALLCRPAPAPPP